ncbi:hypothetical protein HID58_006186 [Brassica napus]|uniref:Protein kinase domain-containing protein n=1 Tax=Brassica napus TaxID=3708 RepID=A0ABQ8EDL0_BRANA|nr:hypothetical protein HID58_006186 [Brassica napus]
MFVKHQLKRMCLLRHLMLPIWVLLGFSFFSVVFVTAAPQEILISQASPRTGGAQSPGPPIVKVVIRQDLNKKILIALIASSTLLCITVMMILYLLLWRYRSMNNNSFNGIKGKSDSVKSSGSTKPVVHKVDSVKKGTIPVYEYQLLESGTNKFSDGNVLSRGGRGCLYSACLDGKSSVTVKKLDVGGETDIEKQFENEVDWLAKIKHQNVISLLGFSVYRQTRCIVYEMMQNGSLESRLHGPSQGSGLTWQLRMKIAVDIARGLEYLHEHCHPPVVHRDLKSSNILLDSDFNAKISDFGYATVLMTQNKNLNRPSEYLLDGKVTDKNDVYSFGVILLELLLGKRSVVEKPSTEPESVVTWAVPKLSDRANLPNILDPAIKGTMDLKHLYQVAAKPRTMMVPGTVPKQRYQEMRLEEDNVKSSFSNIQIDPNSTRSVSTTQENHPVLKPVEDAKSISKGVTFSSFTSLNLFLCVNACGPDESKKGSAKSLLHEMCISKRWKPPVYDCCNVDGPCHMRLFTYKVVVEIRDSSGTTVLECFGDPKHKKKAAAEHAAEGALWYLDHVKPKQTKAASVTHHHLLR